MDAGDIPIGLRYGLPIENYHGDVSSISKSGLDLIARSPSHYWARHLDPARPPMRLGTMTHCAILETAEFNNRYAVGPVVATKAAKEWKAFAATLAPGVEPITEAEHHQVFSMAASVRTIAPLRDLLAAGAPEVSAFFRDDQTGVLCRCRPDWVSPAGDGVILCDVKTTIDASPDAFTRSVMNYGYARQAAMCTDGYEAASGRQVYGFVFAVVEKDHPHAAAAYMLDETFIEQGRRQYRSSLATYAKCLRTNNWPGYTTGGEIRLLTPPAWALSKDTE